MATKHYVDFYSPGTFVSEQSRREVPSWDILAAIELANGIQERHGAKPYGFRFSSYMVHDPIPDGQGGELNVEPKEIAKSELHYLGGEIKRFDDVPETQEFEILRSNMRCNRNPVVIENRNSYRFTGVFAGTDCIVGPDGSVVRRANDADLVEYSEKKNAEFDAYYEKLMASYA